MAGDASLCGPGTGAHHCRERDRIAINKTAARRGHNDITLFADVDQARVLFATEGRDANTITAFADDLATQAATLKRSKTFAST